MDDGAPFLSLYVLAVIVHTTIGGEESWPQWWVTWLKLRIRPASSGTRSCFCNVGEKTEQAVERSSQRE